MRPIPIAVKVTMLFLIVALCVPLTLLCHSAYTIWSYMRPYRSLVHEKASEARVIALEGEPNLMITDDAELRKMMDTFEPLGRTRMHVESKVYLYWADPWSDGDGYAVYIFFNSRGRAVATAFAR